LFYSQSAILFLYSVPRSSVLPPMFTRDKHLLPTSCLRHLTYAGRKQNVCKWCAGRSL